MATATIDPRQATNVPAVLALLQAGQITTDQASQRIAELTAAAQPQQPLTLKWGEKGTLSLYGINSKFPVALYPDQWVRVAEHMPQILRRIQADVGKAQTSDKPETPGSKTRVEFTVTPEIKDRARLDAAIKRLG